MKKLYQREWHGIRFDSFAKISHRKLAASEFYSNFYAAFYKLKKSWTDLDPSWLKNKLQIADHILNRVGKRQSVLSIGCGLGIVERHLLSHGVSGLEATEVSDIPLRWIFEEKIPLPLHVGLFPQCIPGGRQYEYIYCGDIDYCFNELDWVAFLGSISPYLQNNGRILILGRKMESLSTGQAILYPFKELLKSVLRALGLRREQFWGWSRTRSEYVNSIRQAKLVFLEDGFLANGTYWIEAELAAPLAVQNGSSSA